MPPTNYAINKHLNLDFGGTAYSPPGTYYIGMSTTLLAATDTSGSVATEPTTGSYARVPFTNNKSNWSTATAQNLYNITSASFPQSSASQGTMVSVFLADNVTTGSGIIWYYYTLTPPIIVQQNTIVPFDTGSITASET